MTVRQLIAALKKMPQDVEVGLRDHDAGIHEISTWVDNVTLIDKKLDAPCPPYVGAEEKRRYHSMPPWWVALSS